jgi:hypothetical protein
VFVDDAAATVTLIDVARATDEGAPPTPRQGSLDLAALLCSLPFGSVGRMDVVRLVREATGARGTLLREWLLQIARRTRKLRLRTRWRHAYVGAAPDLRRALGGVPDDRLFDALLAGDRMCVQRTLPDRENRRFDPPSGPSYFMKVYPPVRQGLSPAMRELDALDLFARSGVPVCAAAAYGEDLARGSFVVLRGCDGMPLDDLLRRGVSTAERRALCRATAELFRALRRAGVRHRDAYPCHVFAAPRHAPNGPPRFELRLIDLARAGEAPFPRERWFVKDAAQLWYGLPRPPVTRADAVRWLRVYFAVPRLDAAAKRFARRVTAKADEIGRRQSRRARRRAEDA